jgi:hypothetical protein
MRPGRERSRSCSTSAEHPETMELAGASMLPSWLARLELIEAGIPWTQARGGRAEALAGVRRSMGIARAELAHRRRAMHSGQGLCSPGWSMQERTLVASRGCESLQLLPRAFAPVGEAGAVALSRRERPFPRAESGPLLDSSGKRSFSPELVGPTSHPDRGARPILEVGHGPPAFSIAGAPKGMDGC